MLHRIGIVVKPKKPEAVSLAKDLVEWLSKRNIQVYVDEQITPALPSSFTCPRSQISNWADLLIVLGGDGTLLSAVRAMEGRTIPILGVNLGGLGFLTEITLDEVFPVLEGILSGCMELEKRMKLDATVLRGGEPVGQYSVLNDVVVTSLLARIMDLRASVDGAYVTTYRGDGVIVSTPTGSTAYSLAAGGPIVYPTMDSILITPICPHTLTNRPLVIPEGAAVELTLVEENESDVRVTFDGQVGVALQTNDQVIITKSRQHVDFIKPPATDYFQILRTKFKWGER